MVKSSEDSKPLTQSPSITLETKARFNQLLNEALSREKSSKPLITCGASGTRHSDGVPKIIPRKKGIIKLPESDQEDNISSIHSSAGSSGSRRDKQQVIAEVHSSQTHLLQSSSEDDILSEKKEKKRKKKFLLKELVESVKHKEGADNKGFIQPEVVEERSSSRLSNRSYIVETPTFPQDKLNLLPDEDHPLERSSIHENPQTDIDSPSKISNTSYVIETTNETEGKNISDLPKIKLPVPLPRRKSLKSLEGNSGKASARTPDKSSNVADGENKSDHTYSIIPVLDSTSQRTGEISRSSCGIKLHDSDFTGDDVNVPLSERKQKRKRKRRKRSESREGVELQELSAGSSSKISMTLTETRCLPPEETALHSENSGDHILEVTIHGVDCPLVDVMVRHPVVRLHILDMFTGEYYKKSDPNRSVCYYGETNTSYVQPIMTHPFDFKYHRSVSPQWEESLLLNDSFSHLLTVSSLLLFELCDFVTAPVASSSSRHHKLGSASGWHVVAWAFLRPVATGGSLNIASKLRLQLFRPAKMPKSISPLTPVVYEWWGTAARNKYPGCLFVTISAVTPPSVPFSPRVRSRLALQAEEGSAASVRSASAAGSGNNSEDNQELQVEGGNHVEPVVWSRLAAQSCKLPTARLNNLPVDGCMCLQFSANGLWLACAKQDIKIYSVPHFRHTATLSAHQGLVYSLCWSKNGKKLLSASADSTVCVWRPHHRKSPLLQMLGHPSFVYSCQFVPTRGCCTLVTGCYDGMVRLWQGETKSTYQLRQELASHSGFVLSVCVTIDGTKVISADSQGSLKIYEVDDDGSLSGGIELRIRELRGTAISNVLAHPGGHRLLVQSRDSTVRSLDIATGAVIHTLKGLTNNRMQMGMCVTACGSLVFACSEDGNVTAWDGHTGMLRGIYYGLLPPGCAAIHYHPHEHMLALSSLSHPPVHILIFDRNSTGEDIGLTIINDKISAEDVIEKIKFVQKTSKWQKAASKIIPKSPASSIPIRGKNLNKNYKDKNSGNEMKDEKSRKNWPNISELECESFSGDKDLRLLEIIRKMDSMILAAKQSSHHEIPI